MSKQRIREKEEVRKTKCKLDKYELDCLIMCLNGTTFLKEERNQIRKDSLLKVIDIYDNMTIKQKKMIELTDREYTLVIECLALTKD